MISVRTIKTRKQSCGFTLVEVLLAVAILSIIVLLLVNLLAQVQLVWIQNLDRVDRMQRARIVLSTMTKDIASAKAGVIWPISTFYPTPSGARYQFVVNPSLPTGVILLRGTDSVFMQVPVSNSQGGTAIVGYYVNTSRELIRYYVTPDNGLAQNNYNPSDAYSLSNLTLVQYVFSGSSSLVGAAKVPWLNTVTNGGAMPASYFDPGLGKGNNSYGVPITPSSIASPMADSILGFWVRCLDADGNDIPFIDPNDQNYPTTARYDSCAPSFMGKLPGSVEITLALTDATTAKRFPQQIAKLVAISPTSASETAFQNCYDQLKKDAVKAKLPPPRFFTARVMVKEAEL